MNVVISKHNIILSKNKAVKHEANSDVYWDQDLSNIKQVSTTLLTFSKQVTETKTSQNKVTEMKRIPLYMHFSTLGWSNCNIHTLLPRILYLTAYIKLFYLIFLMFYKLQILCLRHSCIFYTVCVFSTVKMETSNLKYSCKIYPFCILVMRAIRLIIFSWNM